MTELKKPSILFSALLASPALVLVCLSLYSLTVSTRDNLLREQDVALSNEMAELASEVRSELSQPILHLQGTVLTPTFQDAMAVNQNKHSLFSIELTSLLYRTPSYISAHWMDDQGLTQLHLSLIDQQLQMNNEPAPNLAYLVENKVLQDYEVLVSKPELLRNQGELVRPFMAVMHYIIKLPDQHGFVVLTKRLNQYAQYVLDANNSYWIALDDGQWLWHDNRDWIWGREFDENYLVSNTVPELWQALQNFPNDSQSQWGIIQVSAQANEYHQTPVSEESQMYWIYQNPSNDALSLTHVLFSYLIQDVVLGLLIILVVFSWAHISRTRTYELKVHEQALQERTYIAEQHAKAKSEFLANMSHEIRTPMNAILGLIELIEDEPLTDRQKQKVSQIQFSGQVLVTIINDILDLSKIESGRLTLSLHPTRLDYLIEHLVGLFEQSASSKGLVLKSDVDSALSHYLMLDQQRLAQVLNNLVGNALKFTSKGAIVIAAETLTESKTTLTVRIAVRDSGRGIAESKLSTIFDSFTQEDSSITRQYGGTGLGLTISQNLVKKMGATGINVTSRVGQGSVFSFDLPLTKATDIPGAELLDPTAPVAGVKDLDLTQLTVVVVDDTPANLMVAQAMLEKLGCTAVCLDSGKALLKWLDDNVCNLVLLDVQMPEMSGLEVAKILRSKAVYKNLPIIALSAATLDEDVNDALESGMDMHIAKPFSLTQLEAGILRVHCADKS